MIRALVRKAWADLRTRPLSAALVFVMVAAATATLTMAVVTQRTVGEAFHRSFEASNGVHAWLYTDVGPDHLARVGRLDDVVGTVGPYAVSGLGYNGFQAIKGDDRYLLTIWITDAELPAISTPLLTHGRWLSAGSSDEIAVDRVFARTRGIDVGERLEIVTASGNQRLKVVGLAINADRPLYRVWSPGRVFVLPKTFERLSAGASQPNLQWGLGVRIKDADATEAFIAEARRSYGSEAPPFGFSWLEVRDAVDEESILTVLFLSVFGVFAVVATGLVIVNRVGSSVLSQVRDIGLLKAVGFTPRLVRALFILEHAGIGLAGAAVGAVVGAAAARFSVENAIANLSVGPVYAIDPVPIVVIALSVTVFIAMLTLIAAWRGGSVSTIEAIRGAGSGATSRRSRPARWASALRLPPIVVLGVKDTFSRPVRAWLTISALILAVITATFALSTESIIQSSLDKPWVIGMDPFEVLVNRGVVPEREARRIIESRPEVESYVTRKYVTTSVPGRRLGLDADALGGAYQQLPYNITAGRMLETSGEVVISRDVAEEFGLGVGDRLDLAFGDMPLRLTVVGEYATFIAPMMLDLATLRGPLGLDLEPDYYGLTVRRGTDLETLRASLESDSRGRFDVDLTKATLEESIPTMRTLLFGLAAVLLVIAAANVLTTILFAVQERRRDIAVFKTVGMRPGQVVTSVLVSGALSAAVALVIGIPLGVVITQALYNFLFASMNIGAGIVVRPDGLWLAALVPIVLLVALLGSILPARRAARLQVVEALRYE